MWEAFNKTCTRLREFNWIVEPFMDDFFQVFGAYSKPQLTHLTFSVNMLWDWSAYFSEVGKDDARALSPNGINARDAEAALKACPGLLNLEVCFYHPIDEDILDNPTLMYSDRDVDFVVSEYPRSEVFNQDIFGDQLCVAAAENCPLLESITFWEVADNANLKPISTFTDSGLVALTKLEWLSSMELRPINCSGNGIFALLNDFPKTFGGQYDMQISVGGENEHLKLKFYEVITQLLTLIATSDDVKFADCRVGLRLINSKCATLNPAWSKDYLSKLEALIAEVKEKHPNIRLRCSIRGRTSKGFWDIMNFGIFTASSEPSMCDKVFIHAGNCVEGDGGGDDKDRDSEDDGEGGSDHRRGWESESDSEGSNMNAESHLFVYTLDPDYIGDDTGCRGYRYIRSFGDDDNDEEEDDGNNDGDTGDGGDGGDDSDDSGGEMQGFIF